MIETEALRKKVIDLAIQGKLTQQLPEDGNADDLYVQIQKEKAELIKEGKIKKEKPLPEISDDEIPFEIPGNWRWIRLCDISETNIGLTYHPENIVDNGTVVLRSNNIVNGTFDYSDLVRVNCTVRNNQYIRKNDILICSRNGSKRLVGKCAIYDGAFGDVSFGAFMAILRTSFFRYLYFYLLTDCFRRYFSSDDTKQINQVTQDILKKAVVPFPPISEQKRIVEKLDDVLNQIDIIDNLQKQYESDREILKGKIIDAGIRGKLTEQLPEDGSAEDLYAQIQAEKAKLIKDGKIKKDKPLPEITDDEIPFEIPKNWKWVRLLDCGITQTGNTPSKTHPEYFGNDLPFIGPGDILNGRISFDRQGLSDVGKSFGRVCNEGSIMQVCIGGSIGKCAITDRQTAFNQQINTLTPLSCVSEYLYYVLCSGFFTGFINHFSAGMATPIINKSSWESLIVPLPPLREQVRIADLLEDIVFTLSEWQRV